MASPKKQRRAFLDDFCESFGISRADSRRSHAGKIYIEFGEQRCRTWLASSNHKFRTWSSMVNKAKWEKVVNTAASKKSAYGSQAKRPLRSGSKKKTRKRTSKSRRMSKPFVGTSADEDYQKRNAVRHEAIVRRGQIKSQVLDKTGTKKTKHTSKGKARVGEGKRRRAHNRALANARNSAKSRVGPNVTPTVLRRDPYAELVELRTQLADELSKGGHASQFLLAGLRARIAELSAETGTPKM